MVCMRMQAYMRRCIGSPLASSALVGKSGNSVVEAKTAFLCRLQMLENRNVIEADGYANDAIAGSWEGNNGVEIVKSSLKRSCCCLNKCTCSTAFLRVFRPKASVSQISRPSIHRTPYRIRRRLP